MKPTTSISGRQIRARFTDKTIRVYQAYSSAIADPVLKAQRFVPPFKTDRMTWIKPSFFWMMYRSDWATKVGQERVLAIDISRDGFEWALRNACLSHFDPQVHESYEAWKELKDHAPVRVQWDPERDCQLQRLEYRSIQVGLSGEAVERYAREWVQSITDVTDFARKLQTLDGPSRTRECGHLINQERPYSVPQDLVRQIGITL